MSGAIPPFILNIVTRSSYVVFFTPWSFSPGKQPPAHTEHVAEWGPTNGQVILRTFFLQKIENRGNPKHETLY
jgi:hypothetical protein